VQEEACILKVPCVTLRDNTERPETLEVGDNVLAGDKPHEYFGKSLYDA
jgi:UDP-N-acetylglucosamine 2-epimerase (non-hydrolysing)